MELTTEQQQLVELALRVPADDIATAKRVLERLIQDPFWVRLESAPIDDEEVTADDLASLASAEAEFARGETISHEEIRREFGLE